MVHFTMREAKDAKIMGSEKDVPIGHIVMAKIDKNKAAPPLRKCEFRVKYLEGVVDEHIEIGTLGIKYGVVERPNNRTYVYEGEKYVGKDNFFDAIKAKKLGPDMLSKVKKAKESGIMVPDEEEKQEEQWTDVVPSNLEEE
jgi:hypothetical protein